HAVFLVVVGVGALEIELDAGLAVHGAGVGHGDGGGEDVGVGVILQAVHGVLVGGVGQAEAEGEAHLRSVVPAAARRLGAHGGVGVALAQDGVLIPGLVVL